MCQKLLKFFFFWWEENLSVEGKLLIIVISVIYILTPGSLGSPLIGPRL